MSIAILTYPRGESLADVAQLRKESALTEAESAIPGLVRAATGAIETHCHRPFSRAVVQETIPGYGGTLLMLARTPIVAVASVLCDNSPVVDYTIEDGIGLYRELGWLWSYGSGWWLDEYRVPRGESRPYVVTYTGGYLLPDDDLATADLSVVAADRSFNLAAGTFPLLVPGDRIVSSEFKTTGNNGTWTVATRADQKVTVVEAGLVNEAADPDPKALRVRTLPASIERAANETVKSWAIGRERDPSVASRSITGLSISYAPGQQGGEMPFPPTAMALLAPFRRAV